MTRLLSEVQASLHAEATDRLNANITRDVTDMAGLQAFFAPHRNTPGWVELSWAKPTGAVLDKVVEQLKTLKLTIRNAPAGAAPVEGACFFTGEPAVERILVARAY